MSAITDGEYAVAVDLDGEHAGLVRFMHGDELVCTAPSRPGFSYLWYRDSNGGACAMIQLDGTSDREILWPYRLRSIGGVEKSW